jgi:branched-chain amino acid transport system ATP-binding protein
MTWFPTRKHRERERRQRVEAVMDRCGLLPARHELAGSLPIGVARMVEFARAIVDTPKVLLLDEPASGLDDTEIERLGAQIQAVRRDTNCAVLLVEHNAGFVMEQSDRIVVLTLGSVLASGLPEEIQRNQQVRDAYLGESDAATPGSAVARH